MQGARGAPDLDLTACREVRLPRLREAFQNTCHRPLLVSQSRIAHGSEESMALASERKRSRLNAASFCVLGQLFIRQTSLKDLRILQELSQLHVNLTSVLENPREAQGVDLLSDGNSWTEFVALIRPASAPTSNHHRRPSSGSNQDVDELESLKEYVQDIAVAYEAFRDEHGDPLRRSGSASEGPGPPRSRRRSRPTSGTLRELDSMDRRNPLSCFDEVPSIYFGDNFSLEDPSTFQQCVLEASVEAQEMLPEHLDSVEGALLQQIKDRSNRFFEALDALEIIKKKVRSAGDTVVTLRRRIAKLRKDIVQQSGRIPKLQRNRKNVESLSALMSRCVQVIHSKESIQILLDNREYGAALEVISSAQKVIDGDLARVHALRPFHRQLSKYKDDVANELVRMFIARTVTLTMEDVENGAQKSNEFGEDNGEGEEEAETVVTLPTIWKGLQRCGCVQLAVDRFHDRLKMELEAVMKTVVVEYVQSEEQSNGGMGSGETDITHARDLDADRDPELSDDVIVTKKRLCNLSPNAFRHCLEAAFEAILSVLRRCQTGIMYAERHLRPDVDPDKAALEKEETKSQNGDSGTTALKDTLKSGCDVAQRRVVSLLTMRKEQDVGLSLEDLKALWDTVMQFVLDVEKLAGAKNFSLLRVTLLTHTRGFLERKVQEQKTHLVNTLDAERWVRADVTPERQASLEGLMSGYSAHRGVGQHSGADTKSNGETSTAGRRRREDVVLEGRRFKVVWSVLLLLDMAKDLLSILAIFPALAVDVLTRLRDLLKLYNNRSYHLVLLGEATQSTARLPSIRAKHLALSSQSLHLLTHVMPHVRAALLGHLPQNRRGLLEQLDKVGEEIGEHHHNILSKLVNMVSEVFQANQDVLRNFQWDAGDSAQPNSFLNRGLEANRNMTSVLNRVLPPEQTQEVLTRVSDAVERLVRESLSSTLPETENGKQRLVDDLRLLTTALARDNPNADQGSLTTLLRECAERFGVALDGQ